MSDERTPWIGVDLDGTLAYYNGWIAHNDIGEPVPKMQARVIFWQAQGYLVKIFTARAAEGDLVKRQEFLEACREWSIKHFGEALPVTCVKDYDMLQLWDDRAVQVTENTGEPVGTNHL